MVNFKVIVSNRSPQSRLKHSFQFPSGKCKGWFQSHIFVSSFKRKTLIFSILAVVEATLITSHSLLGYNQVYNYEGSGKFVMARKKSQWAQKTVRLLAPRRKYKFRKDVKKLSSVMRVIGPRKNTRFLIPVSKFSKVQLSKTKQKISMVD